jgi:hypothetical protein
MYGATLLEAISTGRQVIIYGGGGCDAYGVETVAGIQAL